MQKASVRGGFETGVMLDYIPAETDYRGIDQGAGRLAATVVYQPFTPAPQRTLWIAARYLDLAQELYAAASLDRTLAGCQRPAAARNTRATESFNKRRGLQHVHVAAIGADFARAIAAASNAAAAVSHVDLCLDDPGIGVAVEAAAAGILLLRAAAGVRSHRRAAYAAAHLSTPLSSFAPKLANAGAIELLARMRREYEGAATVSESRRDVSPSARQLLGHGAKRRILLPQHDLGGRYAVLVRDVAARTV